MSADAQALFRQEVLDARADDALGEALGVRSRSTRWLTGAILLLAAGLLCLLVLGSYTKKERVGGVIQPERGIASVTHGEGGVVKAVRVAEGQQVSAGDVLVELSNERYSDLGSTHEMLERNLAAQRQEVLAQGEARQLAHEAARASLQQRAAQARRDQEALEVEIRLQGQQIASVTRVLERLKPLLDDRIIAELQYEQQRQALTEHTARLQALKRQKNAVDADLNRATTELRQISAQNDVGRAGVERELLDLGQRQLERRLSRVTLLKAPFDGVVSTVMVTPGQAVGAGAVLAQVMPAGARLEAVLYVPSTAVGFIAEGQRVRINYDAYPYQRFGQYGGVVRSVSRTDLPMAGNPGTDRRSVFVVRVRLDRLDVEAYGSRLSLRPGLTLTADIEIDRRRLIRWMLDPVLAFSGRL